jgi:hypothetical protein
MVSNSLKLRIQARLVILSSRPTSGRSHQCVADGDDVGDGLGELEGEGDGLGDLDGEGDGWSEPDDEGDAGSGDDSAGEYDVDGDSDCWTGDGP